MKKFNLEVPVVVKLMVGVEAESKEEAIEKVFNGDFRLDIKDEEDVFEYVDWEWEMHEKVVNGNVYYSGINQVYVEKYEDDEE